MEVIEGLERVMGGRWTGVVFNREMPLDEGGKSEMKQMRFCEAVRNSYTSPVTLTRAMLNCLGGRWTLGWEEHPELVVSRIAKENSMSTEMTAELVSRAPRADRALTAVTIGSEQVPDVIVSYIQACDAMKLVRRWQQKTGNDLLVSISSLMAVCGNVVRSFQTKEISISFGCPESRKYGDIGRDRLVIAVPYGTAQELI